ncbi:MAG TPA: PPE domain-containing protein [Candidatus Scybalocola faecavium]|nr:PPE domain-containing protein [Candidatus Scybalocola faecavium]
MAQLSKTTIEINFKNACNQASQLEQLAQELNQIAASQLSGTLQSVAGSWKGDSANLFLQKGNSLVDQISASAQALKDAAASIKTIAKNTYNAEMRALELARIRESEQI